MNTSATHFSQAVGGPGPVIGYGDSQNEAFRHGWNNALNFVYLLERAAVGDSIIEELGMRFGEPEEGHVLSPSDFEALRDINKRLFGDGSHLTPDQRRDLANRMHVLLLRARNLSEGS